MERDIYKQLLAWRSSARRKPLVLLGARQVGKTYILKTFAEKKYENLVYLDFDADPALADLFADTLNPQNILRLLSIKFTADIKPGKTLLVFDEVQECPAALNSLKYFNESANEFHVIAAGSLLGIKLKNIKGFPVGKVNFLALYPLSFCEFLTALGKQQLRDYLAEQTRCTPIAEPFHLELIKLLKTYMFVGGMPEAVASYIANDNFIEVRTIHNEILKAYTLDFAKHAPLNQIMKITQTWDSVINQLAKENKKFIFSVISKSVRAREYETAIQWLVDAGLIYKSYNITVPKLPLEAYSNKNAFKIFLLDVGLLGAMGNTTPQIIIEGDKLFAEYNGAFTENFVAQELVCNNHNLYYWTSEGIAEVDFIIKKDNSILPLEVKAGISKQKKSLQLYAQKYRPTLLLRASLRNLKQDNEVCNYPLYMLGSKIFP